MAIAFALPALVALIATTDRVLPFALVLTALGVATLWLGYVRDWIFLRWPAAVVADFAVVGLTLRVVTGHGVESAGAAMAIQLLLVAAYLISVVIRTLVRGRTVVPFEVVQIFAALAAGLGGAAVLARETSVGTRLVGAGTLGLAAVCYLAALAFVAKREGVRRNFHYYATLGLILALAGLPLTLGDGPLGLAFGALGLAAVWRALRAGPAALAIHAAAFALAAAATSGVLTAAAYRLAAPAGTPWPPVTLVMLASAALVGAGLAIPAPTDSADPLVRGCRFVILAMTLCGATAAVMEAWRMAGGRAALDPGVLATARTIVIAAAAMGLAWAGRTLAFRESRWLVLPLLAAGALKLVAEDFPHSRPSTLFVALAAYGTALILTPRLTRRRAMP
jgi:hypothetical protein